MAIELHLAKPDNAPWGFRLTGGADFEVPFTIVKVAENGVAQQGGLRIGDVIVKVNEIEVSSLSHSEANDAISKAGNDIALLVFRGQLSDAQIALIAEEENNEEVFNIMEGSLAVDYPERPYVEEEQVQEFVATVTAETNCFDKHELNLTDEEIRSIINPEADVKSCDNIIALAEDAETKCESQEINNLINTNGIDSVTEHVEMNGDVKMHEEVNTEEIRVEEMKTEQQLQSEIQVQHSEVLKVMNECLLQMEEEGRKWSTFLQKPKGNKPVSKSNPPPAKSTYRVKIRTKKDLEKEKADQIAAEEAALAAEEAARAAEIAAEEAARAAEIAAQIAAEAEEAAAREAKELAEYEALECSVEAEREGASSAGEINNNIDAEDHVHNDHYESDDEISKKSRSAKDTILTLEQQLAQVKEQLCALSELPATIHMTLSVITQQLQQIAQESQPHEADDENDLSYAENTETEDEVTELIALDTQELSVVEEELSDMRDTEEQAEAEVSVAVEVDEEEVARKLAEEEARKEEEAKAKKKEKVGHWNRIWPWTHVTQPIYRINFLKYQPPPKNLDYLQKSDVYKMVHDMDTPVKGIDARPEKILTEEDYFVKKGSGDADLPPQMER